MSLPVIQSLWIGKLSKLEQLCLASFLANGHPFHLYVYEKPSGVPEGVTLLDANTILPESEIFFSRGSLAAFSDWFRWKMLEKNGGYWVDMDLICLKPFTFEQAILYAPNRRGGCSVGVLRFPAQHPLTTYMIHRCENPNEPDPTDRFRERIIKPIRKHLLGNKMSNVGWGEAGGPRGFRKGVAKFALADNVRHKNEFYPISPRQWRTIFDNTYANTPAPIETSFAIHLWNEVLRRKHFDKNSTFPKNSLIEQLKARYNI